MSYKVEFQGVTKKYKMYNKPADKIKDLLWNNGSGEYHYALNNISFGVEEGEIVGIVGLNGSGKSTLSNLIAGVTMPNSGKIHIDGSASLIAIGAGLNNQLTGIENIELKGLMMGLNKKEIQEIIPKVIEFAEIGKFINQPVKTYSSGMKSRLGFAISVNIDPDIMVIDEALSVGDQSFTQKCLDKMNEFKENGKTIFFISHSLSQVKEFCTKALWIHYGHVKEYGDVQDVARNYHYFLQDYNKMTKEQKEELRQQQMKEFGHGLLGEKQPDEQTCMPRKKARRKKKPLLAALFTALIIGLGSGAYAFMNPLIDSTKNFIGSQSHTNNTGQNVPVTKEKEPVQPTKYVVGTQTAFVRSDPSLDSAQLGLLSFGDMFDVLEEKTDSVDNIKWAKVKNSSGEEVWISANLLYPYYENKNVIKDDKLAPLNNDIFSKYEVGLDMLLTHLGGSVDTLKKDYPLSLTSERESSDGLLMNYNYVQFVAKDNEVNSVFLRNFNESSEEFLSKIDGKPVFINETDGLYFYQTTNYFIKVYVDVKTNQINLVSFMKK